MSPLRTASVFNEISSDEVSLICFCILKRGLRIVLLFSVKITTTVAYADSNSITLYYTCVYTKVFLLYFIVLQFISANMRKGIVINNIQYNLLIPFQ